MPVRAVLWDEPSRFPALVYSLPVYALVSASGL